MRQKGFAAIMTLALLSLCPFLISSDNYKVASGPPEFYYGHVSLADIKNDGKDVLIFREGMEKPEIAIVNFPLGPGDTIRTSDERRCEIQFDNATILRLDVNTELKIETIMAQNLSSMDKLSNLFLAKGQIYIMYKEYNSKEIFQVVTPYIALKLRHNSVAMIGFKIDGTTDVQVEFGKVSALFGPDQTKPMEKNIYRDERFTVFADQTFCFSEYAANTDFDAWNKAINKDFPVLHDGKSMLPKSIQRLPKAVFYFAQTYGNLHGEWIYDDFLGDVWRPFYNDYCPWGNWQPFLYGRWANYAGQLFWVPDEPWGWVPYHLGVWHWDNKKGWLWIPGSAFAPAWVEWAFYESYCAWQPWSMWDWMMYDDLCYYDFMGYYYDPWYDWGYAWDPDPRVWAGTPPARSGPGQTLTKISKDQLKRPSHRLIFEMPEELRKPYKALAKAMKKGDENVLVSLRGSSKHSLVVSTPDLNTPKIQGKAVKLELVLNTIRNLPSGSPQKTILNFKPRSPEDSASLAVRSFEKNARMIELAELKNNVPSGLEGKSDDAVPVRPSRAVSSDIKSMVLVSPVRFHDWNPDFRIAQQIGVDIHYIGGRNEIYCPQLRLSSTMVRDSPILKVVRSSSGSGGGDPWAGRETTRGTGADWQNLDASSGGAVSAGGSSSSAGSASNSSASSSSTSSSSSSSSGHIRHKG
jgi:hypothetical protein